jgi:hypothetical protein
VIINLALGLYNFYAVERDDFLVIFLRLRPIGRCRRQVGDKNFSVRPIKKIHAVERDACIGVFQSLRPLGRLHRKTGDK